MSLKHFRAEIIRPPGMVRCRLVLLLFIGDEVWFWLELLAVMICIFLNLSYYFYVSDDIQNTLTISKWPLLLLVMLSVAAYGTIFYSMNKFTEMYALETESKRDKSKFVLLYIDLDEFQVINDTYGHEVGDEILFTVGNRLLKDVRKTDFVALLGGDEFADIVHDINNTAVVKDFAKKINGLLQDSFHMDSILCKVNASIGIAIYPDSGKDSETLLRNADSAMYEIKRKGKSGVGIFINQLK